MKPLKMDNGEEKPTTKNEKNENLDSTGGGQNSTPKKRKRKEVAIFGNYRNYYGYRISQELEEDPRLKVFKKEWFEGKDCLDIGCNSGLITINIAKKFCCRSILGVDIDSDRIEEAHWNLRKIAKTSTRKLLPKASKENVEGVNNVDHPVTEPLSEETRKVPGDSSPSTLLDKVSFQRENFVLSRRPEDKRYDTIICLSVTKWIHLNWGDDGLINLFAKIWRLLQPGGMLILEPQPWKSYYKNRQVSETAQNNYHKIEIYPENFQEILLDKIGFRFVENISCNLPGSKSGFQRPILAFWK